MADRNLRMQLILEGLDRVTAPLKSITNASSGARRDLAETQKQLKALDALQKQVGGYKAAEGRFASDHQQLQQTQARVAQLRHELEATEAPTKKLRTEFEKAQRQASMLTDRVDAGGKELQQLQRQLEAAGIDVADLAAHEDRLSSRVYDANKALKQQIGTVEKLNQANRNTQKLNDISAKATGAGLGMIAAGTAAGLPVVAATKQAMTLESAMADVSKVTNMTRPQIDQMSTDFLDMSETIPVPAEGLAQIAAAAGAAGVGMDKMGRPMADQRQQLQEFTADAAKMGVAFDMTADVAGETMAKWRTAFELPQDGVRALGDRVNALTNTFGGKAANVTDIITRIGPLGKVAGLAAPQVAALGSTLDSIGVPSEVAATGIKNTMLALTKGEAATKSQQGAFKALGLSATDVAKRMQTDAAGAIVDVMTRIGKLDADQQSGVLTQLFGSESVAAIAPMLTNLDGLKNRLALVGDESRYAGSMQAEFLNRIGVTEGATGLATNALSGLNITMGKALLPTVVKLAGMVQWAASGLRHWAQEHPGITKAVMIFMGVGSGLLIVLGGLALAFAALTAAAAPLGIALGPLLLIVAAIAALAALVYVIYDNWGAMVGWLASLWDTIRSNMVAAIGALVDIFLNFTPLGLMIRAFLPVFSYLRSLDFAAIGRYLIDGLIGGITSRLSALKSTVINAASSVSNWFKEKMGIHSPSRLFASYGDFMMQGLEGGIIGGQDGPLERIKTIAGDITRALAVGAAVPSIAAAATPGSTQAGGGGLPASHVTYAITVHVSGGAQAQEIADKVREAIEQIERERRGRGFGDEGDE